MLNTFHQYPFVRLLLPLIAGIAVASIAGSTFILPSGYILASLIVVIALAILSWRYLNWRRRWIFGCGLFLFIMICGYELTLLKTEKLNNAFFGKYYQPGDLWTARLTEPIQEKDNSNKAVVMVTGINKKGRWVATRGKAIVYFGKDTLSSALRYGDCLMLGAKLSNVKPPYNPWQFDYQNYLANKGVYHQAFAYPQSWQRLKSGEGSPLYAFAYRLRDKFLRIFEQNGIRDKEYAVGSALILGYTDKLDADLMKEYSGSGAMHILSVSGLHVGVIYLVLNYLLFFMNKRRSTRLIKELILFTCIWYYALLTGLSPAVLRATTMFSFVIVGNILNRHANIYNSLAASAFFLLLVNPWFITDVGFQLSYLAVAGIVMLQRNIYNLWLPENRLLDQIWQLVAVSIAAQMTTFPLSLFYFHQFPNYFLITNLIAIPLSSLVIYSGMLVLLMSPIAWLSHFFSHLMVWLLTALNFIVKYIEELPFAMFQHVFISRAEMFLCYLIIFSLVVYFSVFQKIYFRLALAGLFVLIFSLFIRTVQQTNQQKFIVYSVKKSSAFDFIDGKQHLFLTDTSLFSDDKALSFNIQNNWFALGLRKHYALPFSDNQQLTINHIFKKGHFVQLGDQRFAIIDPSFHKIAIPCKLKVNYLIVSHNPEFKISDLLHQYDPGMVIFDSSNPLYKIKKWQQECQHLGLPSYSVPESGAFVKDI